MTQTDRTPDSYHPELTQERLEIVARLIADASLSAVEHHSPEDGETEWSLGTRRYERIGHAIQRTAESGQYEWLQVFKRHLYFLVRIGGVPIKFFRGDPSEPSKRVLKQHRYELQLRQQAFAFMGESEDVTFRWRLSYQTNLEGEVFRVTLLMADDNDKIVRTWEIQLVEGVISLAKVIPFLPEPVDLGAPPVAPKVHQDDESAAEENNEGA